MRKTIIIFSLLLFLAGGFYLDRATRFAPVKRILQSKTVPTKLFNYGSLGIILKHLGLVVAVPKRYSSIPASKIPEVGRGADISPKRPELGKYLFHANPGGENILPSSLIINEEDFLEGWPLLSIVVDEDDLYSPKNGIVANWEERGLGWERLAYLSYYEDNELLLASAIGLRLHGGYRRSLYQRGVPPWLRLYFRKEYGINQFIPGLLSIPEKKPIKRLVLSKELCTNSLALDISRRIGAITPEFKPVLFFLNGDFKGAYYLMEHLGKRQWIAHMGDDNFAFYSYRGRSDRDSRMLYEEFTRWASDQTVKMTMKEAGKYVDIDNLSRHIFSSVFCGNAEWAQGAAILDMNRAGSRWYWVNWDMDTSFLGLRWKKARMDIWKQPAWELIETIFENDVRSILFRRLLKESPAFPGYLARLVMDLLNHRLNPEFLKSLINRYDRRLLGYNSRNLFKPDQIKVMKLFLENRPQFIRKQMQEYFGLGESIICEVRGPAGIEYEIDGYPELGDYRGWYLPGEPIKITIISSDRENFSHWLVNGEKVEEKMLTLTVNLETVIEPIPRTEQNF